MAHFTQLPDLGCSQPSNQCVMRQPKRRARLSVAGLFVLVAGSTWAAERGVLAEFLGKWRGTSTCVNRNIAPACKDETVVYEVRTSEKPKTAVLKASKIVNGQQLPMGELEFVFSDEEGCWRSEFSTPQVHGVWCLVVDGRSMTGSLRVMPENADVRKVQVVHD